MEGIRRQIAVCLQYDAARQYKINKRRRGENCIGVLFVHWASAYRPAPAPVIGK